MMHQADVTYSTSAREITDITIVAEREHRDWQDCRLSLGEVDVSHQVVSFLKRRQPSGEVISEEPLDLPERSLRTTAVWWTVPGDVLAESGLATADIPGAAHAAEHCSIGLLPLFATCDRWDIGGVSTAMHADTGRLTVFVYDGHPGGAGFAERGFRAAHAWLTATRETIADCECETGCPSCIQSPKCGNQNSPLDKTGADRPAGPAARRRARRVAFAHGHPRTSPHHPRRHRDPVCGVRQRARHRRRALGFEVTTLESFLVGVAAGAAILWGFSILSGEPSAGWPSARSARS